MPRIFCDLNSPTLAELLSDPIVQMAMRADHVTEQQLMSLINDTLSKLALGSQSGSAGNPKTSPGFADYRPGVGIMLLNANNDVFGHQGLEIAAGARHDIPGFRPSELHRADKIIVLDMPIFRLAFGLDAKDTDPRGAERGYHGAVATNLPPRSTLNTSSVSLAVCTTRCMSSKLSILNPSIETIRSPS
jgi:hypothetical protein